MFYSDRCGFQIIIVVNKFRRIFSFQPELAATLFIFTDYPYSDCIVISIEFLATVVP
jgi:hypothetical protein